MLHSRSRVALSLGLIGCALAVTPSVAAAQPLAGAAIGGQYIVVLKPSTSTTVVNRTKTRVRNRGGKVQREYSRALKGFSAKLSKRRWRRCAPTRPSPSSSPTA